MTQVDRRHFTALQIAESSRPLANIDEGGGGLFESLLLCLVSIGSRAIESALGDAVKKLRAVFKKICFLSIGGRSEWH